MISDQKPYSSALEQQKRTDEKDRDQNNAQPDSPHIPPPVCEPLRLTRILFRPVILIKSRDTAPSEDMAVHPVQQVPLHRIDIDIEDRIQRINRKNVSMRLFINLGIFGPQ